MEFNLNWSGWGSFSTLSLYKQAAGTQVAMQWHDTAVGRSSIRTRRIAWTQRAGNALVTVMGRSDRQRALDLLTKLCDPSSSMTGCDLPVYVDVAVIRETSWSRRDGSKSHLVRSLGL